MTLYVLAFAGAVIITALAYKIGQLQERLKNEQSKTEKLAEIRKMRDSLWDSSVADGLHEKYKR